MNDLLSNYLSSQSGEVDLTSLLDVMVVLCASLMICLPPTYLTLDSQLARVQGEAGLVPKDPDAIVVVSPRETLTWDGERIGWTDLEGRLAALRETQRSPTVVVEAAAAATNGFCQQVRALLCDRGANVLEPVLVEEEE